MFDRLIALIGKDAFEKIQEKNVIVLGLGGVGGYVVEGLVRSGIRKMTIVDGDTVDVTNLNRQIIALHSTIGKKKTELFEDRLKDINPDLVLEVVSSFLTPEKIANLNLDKYDYIVDCIDDIRVKVELSRYAVLHKKKIIVSTGTARKMHPEKLTITTLDKTSYDPLAKVLRKELKDISKKIIVLASTESPKIFDASILGSSVFVPASAGLLIASYIIDDIVS